MITSSDETKNGQPCFYSSDHSTSSNHPKVTIEYNTNIGLEDYWSYQTVNMGRSGAAYINNYNGNVTYLHSDLSMTGNLLPINISHVYNTDDAGVYDTYYSGMYVGSKFHLSIQELLIEESSSKYKHYDSDGTLHYYVLNTDTGKITHEYDSTLELTVNDSGYIITDAKGNEKHFNSSGQLSKLADSNGNTQTFTFSGNLITAVTDPAGRTATLSYNSYGQLVSIADPAGRATSYTYNGTASTSNLTNITYPDSKVSKLAYSLSKLYKVTEPDNAYTTFSYKSYTKRAANVYHYDSEGTRVYRTYFKYTKTDASGRSSGNTIVYPDYANQPDKYNLYFFDSYGRATSITNQDKQTQYSVYGNYSSDNTNTYNKLFDSSDLQTISTNLLTNHGFESDEYWSVLQNVSGSYSFTSDESSNGHQSLAMSLTSDTGVMEIGQDFDAESGETYTVSLDVNFDTPDDFVSTANNGFVFGFVYEIDGVWNVSSSQWITSTAGWERFSHTLTIPDGNLTNCHVFVELARATETVYVDSIQVEKSGGARFYNLVENSDFSNAPGATTSPTGTKPYAWDMNNVVDGIDGVQYAEDDFNGHRNYLYMIGTPSLAKKVVQTVPVNASAGDVLIIGGRAAAYATVDAANDHKFGIIADLYDSATDNEPTTVKIGFDRTIDHEHQIKATYVELTEDCHHIVYSFVYYYHIDCVSFDDAFIYVGSYGEHYRYTDEGLTDYSYDDEGEIIDYTYENNNVTEIIKINDINDVNNNGEESNVGETVANYEYDSNHNITKATNNIGTTMEYTYNDAGQVTSHTTKYTNDNNEEVTISESFSYYQNGNYIKTYINEVGGVTTYVYDNDDTGENITKGLVTSVTDPNSNTTTYTYDTNTDELLSTSGEAEPSVSSTTSFTYEDNLPKTITRNGTTYSYEYDAQNRVTESKVGSQTLATNSYDSRQRLSQVTYANNAAYTPVYDSSDRLTGESWNDTQISEYYYNDNDRLSKLVDNITDVSYQYDYVFYGLPFRVTGSDGTQTTYDYDRSGTLARLTFSDDNVNIYSGKYYSNEKGMPEDIVIETLDNALIHYNYDEFGRIESYSYGPIIRKFKYAEKSTENGTTTNNRIIEIVDKNKDGDVLQVYDLEYNPDGSLCLNCENVDQQSFDYIYDGLGRVIENFITEDLYVYSYDSAGNITSIGIWYEPIHTFTYGNENWKDQLTAYDGKAITYDANGNLLTYDGYTYTWQRGTQLAGITGNDKNISYVYDSQGHRVQKTVNGVTTSYLYSGDLLMRQTDGTNTFDFQYDANGDMVGFVYNGEPYYYLRNILNDITGIVDGNGDVVAKYRYDAYGNTVYSTGDMAAINPIRYRGYYYDAETNWYYLKSRYYNPEWCRFISPDCLFIAGDAITGGNMYAYCNNNPVSYVDPSGMYSLSEFVGDTIWFNSKLFSTAVRPLTDELFTDVSNEALAATKKVFDPQNKTTSFAETGAYEIAQPILRDGADWLIPRLGNTTSRFSETYDTPTGARHFIPMNMEFLTPWAEYYLGFVPDTYGRYENYVSKGGNPMWQSEVGYISMYDFFFSLGGPIFKDKYAFSTSDNDYVIWIWKGDYWNLGAGAEIGIYTATESDITQNVENNEVFYQIDTNNTLHVEMTVKYRYLGLLEDTLNVLEDDNWWVCSFTPELQMPQIRWLSVDLKVKFNNDSLIEPFYDKWCYLNGDESDENDWDEIKMAPTPYISKATGHTTHKCNSEHPTECSCSYTCCSKPCRYYSDNGYQFYINY